MSEGDVKPPTMVVAEAHNIGEIDRCWSKRLEANPKFRYLPCSQADV